MKTDKVNETPIENAIRRKVQDSLSPVHFELANESFKHHRDPGGETHFFLVVVSDQFQGKPLLARHQIMNQLFSEERSMGLHALTMKTLTPDEWQKVGQKVLGGSPTCLGGGKLD